MNSTFIDIAFVGFICILGLFGYYKGFVTRLYDLFSTIVVLVLTFTLCKPLSQSFHIYQYAKDDIIASTVGEIINLIIVFIGLFVILFVIKKVIGFIIKPLMKGIVDTFTITSTADSCLGFLFSVAEAVIIGYIVVVFGIIPFVDNGVEIVEDTTITKHIIQAVPELTEQVSSVATIYKTKDYKSGENLLQLINMAWDYGLITEDQFQTILEDNILNQDLTQLSLSEKDIEKIKKVLGEVGYEDQQVSQIIEKIK